MKIQCNVCESAEAAVLCCADEAALCRNCDENVHAANKLASKHQRVPLSNSSNQMPKCDICQETDGYIFCLEDRALLCRKCDVDIHTVNVLVSSHQRFLLTGVKLGLETSHHVASTSSFNSLSGEKIFERKESVPKSTNSEHSKHIQAGDFAQPKLPYGGASSTEGIQQWQFDDLLGLTGLNQNCNYMEDGSSKVECSKMGDSECSSILRALEVELDVDDCLDEVPQLYSPSTAASGICWITS